jgi:hypothetical protein
MDYNETARLPDLVVKTDHELEQAADRASDALAKHRWHWTLDETNPERASFAEYARAIGRDERAVRVMAEAYARITATGDSLRFGRTVQEEIQLQSVKQADREVVEETAKGLGISVSTTRQHHKDDVSRVRDAVAEATEREPDITPERRREVAQRTAGNIRKAREIDRKGREALRQRKSALVINIEGELSKARYGLIAALNYAKDVDPETFPEPFLAEMQRSLDDIEALLKLIRSALGGAAGIDWDAELRKLEVR